MSDNSPATDTAQQPPKPSRQHSSTPTHPTKKPRKARAKPADTHRDASPPAIVDHCASLPSLDLFRPRLTPLASTHLQRPRAAQQRPRPALCRRPPPLHRPRPVLRPAPWLPHERPPVPVLPLALPPAAPARRGLAPQRPAVPHGPRHPRRRLPLPRPPRLRPPRIPPVLAVPRAAREHGHVRRPGPQPRRPAPPAAARAARRALDAPHARPDDRKAKKEVHSVARACPLSTT